MYERKKVNTLAKEYEQILDIYEVDKYGNVYGKNGMELKQSLNSSGYKQVSLKLEINGDGKSVLFIDQLVMVLLMDTQRKEMRQTIQTVTKRITNGIILDGVIMKKT